MKRILLVAGGGGHTGHAYIFGKHLARYYKPVFIIPRNDKYSILKLRGIGEIIEVEKPFEPTDSYIGNIHRLPKALIDASRIKYRNYDAILCFGSNHCIAPVLTGKLAGLTTILVESPMRVVSQSKTYRFLKHAADYIFVSWREQLRYYPKSKTLVIGPYYDCRRYDVRDKGYILVTTGTYGFPELVEEVLKLPLDKAVIQTGRDDPRKYAGRKPEWIFFDYDPDIDKWIAGASLVISHLGRIVIDSVYTYCKPVVIVPNPRWIRGATIKDAVAIAQKTYSILLPSPRRLNTRVIEEAYKRRNKVSKLCRETINGVEIAVKTILRIIH